MINPKFFWLNRRFGRALIAAENVLAKAWYFMYWYGGIGAIHWMTKIDRVEHKRKPSVITLWIIGIYSAFYGIAVQRYELKLSRLYTTFNAYVTRMEFADEALLNGFIALQEKQIPKEPSLNPIALANSFFKEGYDPKIREDVAAISSQIVSQLVQQYGEAHVYHLHSDKQQIQNANGSIEFIEGKISNLSFYNSNIFWENPFPEYRSRSVSNIRLNNSKITLIDPGLIFEDFFTFSGNADLIIGRDKIKVHSNGIFIAVENERIGKITNYTSNLFSDHLINSLFSNITIELDIRTHTSVKRNIFINSTIRVNDLSESIISNLTSNNDFLNCIVVDSSDTIFVGENEKLKYSDLYSLIGSSDLGDFFSKRRHPSFTLDSMLTARGYPNYDQLFESKISKKNKRD